MMSVSPLARREGDFVAGEAEQRDRDMNGDPAHAFTSDGKLDIARLRPLARMGYQDYTAVDAVFEIAPEGPNKDALAMGLGGEAKGRRGIA